MANKNKKNYSEKEPYYAIQSLNLFVTTSCNFSCAHCMRGEPTNEDLSDYTISKVFRHVLQIDTLTLNGGEVFLKPQILEKIVDTIIEKKIVITRFAITTNGTLFTDEIKRILDKLNNYLQTIEGYISISLSQDIYHSQQLDKIQEENYTLWMKYYQSILKLSTHPVYFSDINYFDLLINEGRATSLDIPNKISTRACTHYCFLEQNQTYKGNPILYLGPIIGVDVNGNVCETAGIMPAPKERCYGNIRSKTLESIAKKNFIFLPSFEEYYTHVIDEVNNYVMHFNPIQNANNAQKIKARIKTNITK